MEGYNLETLRVLARNGGSLEGTQLLEDINEKDSDGKTRLLLAAEREEKDVVQLLIRSGADINCCDNRGVTLLHIASEKGWVDIIQDLANKNIDLNSKEASYNATPLLVAAFHGKKDVVELLISFGADIHCCNNCDKTLLHHASVHGWEDMVQYLVDKGVDINGTGGDTPLLIAAQCGNKDIVKLLLNAGAKLKTPCDEFGGDLLHFVVANEWEDLMAYLVDKGIDINAEDVAYFTPLIRAICDENLDMVKCLIRLGANVDCSSSYGAVEPPLMIAAREGYYDIAKLLLSSGAELKTPCDEFGCELLHVVASHGWEDLVAYLVDKGIDINVKDEECNTPLMYSIRNRKFDMVKCLIRLGADIACFDDEKWTPLHLTVYEGTDEIMQYLLKNGADVNVKNAYGNTPLHLACGKLNCKIIGNLLKEGANCNERNIGGNTPLCILIGKNNINAISLCIENGGYVDSFVYDKWLKQAFFKSVFLKDSKLCSQAIINKYNNLILLQLYEVSALSLPSIDKMKIKMGSGLALEIERGVTHGIVTKGYCNLKERPMLLRMSCVMSFLDFNSKVKQMCEASPSFARNWLKILQFDDYDRSHKKRKLF